MSKLEIDKNKNRFWRNDYGKLHRLDGPAIEFSDGSKFWYKNGQRHREDGPAVECNNGYKAWMINNIEYKKD